MTDCHATRTLLLCYIIVMLQRVTADITTLPDCTFRGDAMVHVRRWLISANVHPIQSAPQQYHNCCIVVVVLLCCFCDVVVVSL